MFQTQQKFRAFSFQNDFVYTYLSFVAMLLSFSLLYRIIYKENPFKLLSKQKLNSKLFISGAVIYTIPLSILYLTIWYLNNSETGITLNIEPNISFIFFGIILILFQSTFEEILFRGYLLQGLIKLTNSKVFAAVLSSLLFGLLHYGQKSYSSDLGGFADNFIFGLSMCSFVFLTKSLEFPIGLHWLNNFFICFIVADNPDSLFINKFYFYSDIPLFIYFSLTLFIIHFLIKRGIIKT